MVCVSCLTSLCDESVVVMNDVVCLSVVVMSVRLRKELVDGLRVMFDFTL